MPSTGLRGRKQSQKCKAELPKVEKIFMEVIVKVLPRSSIPQALLLTLRGATQSPGLTSQPGFLPSPCFITAQ